MLKSARRLYLKGFGVHWLRAKSKVPLLPGWNKSTRETWEILENLYQNGYGLGVLLGAASKLSNGYLANIDVDIKSSDPKHRAEAIAECERLFPGLMAIAPTVTTGNGFRLFIATATPVESIKLTQSPERAVVFMPSADGNKAQQQAVVDGLMTAEQMKEGYRVRPAWEIELMSTGKQVVLPPSIHPDTGKPYKWKRPVDEDELPLVDVSHLTAVSRSKADTPAPGPIGFSIIDGVDLYRSSLSDEMIEAIESGNGVTDKSVHLFSAAMAMLRAKYTRDEILTVLTDTRYFLGEVGYAHEKTKSRKKAAAWVDRFTLSKAKKETSLSAVFTSDTVDVEPELLTDEELKEQVAAIKKASKGSWRRELKLSGKEGDGPPKAIPKNIGLILRNDVSEILFRRDLFYDRDIYGCDAPWADRKKGDVVTDDDEIHIAYWLSIHWRFEPTRAAVSDTIVTIATANAFHCVRDELEALPPWDGVNRLDHWLKNHFEAENDPEYLAQVFRKWMVASVTRTYRPGAKFDWIILFEGAQGTGKSSFGSLLFGSKYFGDWLPDLADKDAALGLRGLRCLEFGELDALKRGDLEAAKAFITRQVDKVRPPFGRRLVELARQVVFFGTTNKEHYLKDETGNRRFNPVKTGMLDFKQLEKDRDQLWAEALFIYRNDLEETLYLEGDAKEYSHQNQLEKIADDESSFMLSYLHKFYVNEMQKPEAERFPFDRFKIVSLFENGIGPFSKFKEDRKSIMFAAKTLKNYGGIRSRINGESWWKIIK